MSIEQIGEYIVWSPQTTAKPSMYRIIMHNDDYTPMGFVVEVLELYFHLDQDKAKQVMMEIHTKGKATCGIFSQDVAETKVRQVAEYAERHEHPLLCSVEGCRE